jgi:hydroxyacylglutathione hydrolase
MLEIIAIDTPTLGDRAYLATDGEVALVVDAQRDFDRVVALAGERGVEITHVFETHMHNDYVTGGFALAAAVGAQYLVNEADPVSFDRTAVTDGDLVQVGRMPVRVIATPGHTFTHLSYALLGDGTGGDGDTARVAAAFTGGSLLNGSTGRTDLLGPDHVLALSQAQYNSAHRLARDLPGATQVCPTHGFGSFCAVGPGTGTPGTGAPSTIAQEQHANAALTLAQAEYVDQLLAGLDAYPSYYAHMAPANLAGPPAPDLSAPRRADPAELRRRISAGEWVVDLRARTAFAAAHLRGCLNFSSDGSLATYLGWLIPWGTPLTLIGASADDVAFAQRELCRIGIERIAAASSWPAAADAAGEPLESFLTADFGDLATALKGNGRLVVLDVRRRSEWEEAHISGAVHIPLHELAGRMSEVGPGQVWVHCHSGARAAIAASMLAAAGRDVVAVDDQFGAAAAAGLVAAVSRQQA